jgi:hypothetical protein
MRNYIKMTVVYQSISGHAEACVIVAMWVELLIRNLPGHPFVRRRADEPVFQLHQSLDAGLLEQ